jgi:hypothetical protein
VELGAHRGELGGTLDDTLLELCLQPRELTAEPLRDATEMNPVASMSGRASPWKMKLITAVSPTLIPITATEINRRRLSARTGARRIAASIAVSIIDRLVET